VNGDAPESTVRGGVSFAKRTIIFANGVLNGGLNLPSRRAGDLIIAADGGLRHVLALGIQPDVVIGDLDSVPGELVQLVNGRGAEIIRFPVAKDKTDLELALDLARDRGSSEVVIAGALGGRIDHELANVLLLASPALAGLQVTIIGVGGQSTDWSVPDSATAQPSASINVCTAKTSVSGREGDIVSLLPLGGSVRCIETDGLLYPLAGEDLEVGTTRGVSNMMTSESARVVVHDGVLLVVHLSS
jgi:thiamine pyrophosphokinase